jgi:hypothetical protein
MLVVVVMHVLTIAVSAKQGAIALFAFWYYAALPLFVPGFFAGALCLFRGLTRATDPYRALRLSLGAAALILPVYEIYLLLTLPSGYGGG